MLYYIFDLLQQHADVPGGRLMGYITFRSGAALVLAMLLAVLVGRRVIDALQRMQVGEVVRNLGLEGQMNKTGTPTMGGVIIIAAILVPCLLVANLSNIYMLLMLVATVWLGSIGFLDDYMKLARHNKAGIKGKYKIVGQVGIGLIVGVTMMLSPAMGIVPNAEVQDPGTGEVEQVIYDTSRGTVHTPETTIPFVKNNNFSYRWLTSWMSDPGAATAWAWVAFIVIVIFFVAATSNGANLTDGLDGLATGCSAIIGVALAIMAYLGSSVVYSSYLNIMYVPGSEELVVYMAAFIGALIGFLWYNAYPAQVFMGDTGSLTLGGIIAVFAVLIHKEFMLPILCAIFYVEDLSVMMQVAFFKATGGRRIFKMTPLHHHFQKAGNAGIDALIQRPLAPVPESKIVTRFWIIGILLAAAAFVTLKIR